MKKTQKSIAFSLFLTLLTLYSVASYTDNFSALNDLKKCDNSKVQTSESYSIWHANRINMGSIYYWGSSDYDLDNVPEGSDFISVASGDFHGLGLRTDGSLIGWGGGQSNTGTFPHYGQAIVPSGNDFVAIAAGSLHSLALKSDGSIVSWGRNNFGQTNSPAGFDFVSIACGAYHSLALREDGSIVAWGAGTTDAGVFPNYGQSIAPEGNNYSEIAAGSYHSLALLDDGTLTAWGRNNYNQSIVPAGNNFTAISSYNFHNLALRGNGSISAWGRNTSGQCNVPVGYIFQEISAGWEHSTAVRSDGALVAWGLPIDGQLEVPQGNHYNLISSGYRHSLALGKLSYEITTPNGGETWQSGTEKNITWNYRGIELQLSLQFSPDNGGVWFDIGTVNTTDGSYLWMVPGYDSGDCLIRGFFSQNGVEHEFQSESNFTITQANVPDVSLSYPNEPGLFFQNGQICSISWESSGLESVSIYFSSDNGNDWEMIVENVDALSSPYHWSVPSIPTNSGRIKIQCSEDELISEVSSFPFSIATLEIVTSLGGLEFWGGDLVNVEISAVNSYSFDFYYSFDQGESWTVITESYNQPVFNWITPNKNAPVAFIRVEDSCSPSIFAISEPFSIVKAIDLLSPIGGENINIGEIFTIEWEVLEGISSVLIDYSINSGVDWIPIRSIPYPAGNGYYEWLVPNTPSANCLVRVKNLVNHNTYGVSESDFTISDKTLEIVYPQGGEVWYPHEEHIIEWNSENVISLVIEYSYDGGQNWLTVEEDVDASSHFYTWQIPEIGTENGKLRISDIDNPMVNSTSEGYFVIDFLNPPRNLTAELMDTYLELAWDPPYGFCLNINRGKVKTPDIFSSERVTGYNVYRGGELIISLPDNETIYQDFDVVPGKIYLYFITALYDEVESVPSNTVEIKFTGAEQVPDSDFITMLKENYPNPFNPSTVIRFTLEKEMLVEISVYNVKGQKVANLVNDFLDSGHHEIYWNGIDSQKRSLSSGVYFVKMQTDNYLQVNKIALVK